MIFLDTHVVLWLFAEPKKVPDSVRRRLDVSDLWISPMVRLELCLLKEIGRVKADASLIIGALERDVELSVEEDGWLRAAAVADHLYWTRDPFDRLIAAHAMVYGADLCTRDETMREYYTAAFWD